MEIRDAPKFVKATRLDSVPMPRAYFTPEGYLEDKPVLTSTGIFEYQNPDGSIRKELRLPEDVFDPESLKSYLGKPICISHDAGLIDKDNVAENQIGTILSEGERKGNNVVASIIIHDTDAMKDAGYKELSLGYNLDLDETPGEWHGQHYDARQRNIKINHLALVREARAGEQARLNMDSRDKNTLIGGKSMSKKLTKTRHGDSVLSQEEFEKAIDEYKMRKAQREKTDADDVVEEEVVEEVKDRNPNDVEAQLAEVKARRDRRDEAGDPEDMEDAMSVIAHQDEDIDILYDIIDTLLAKQDFDAADDEEEVVAEEEEVIDDEDENLDEIDDLNKLKENKADAEEEFVEEEEVKEDADDIEDVEDEEMVDEEEEVKEDADDVEEEVVEDKEEWEEDGDDCGTKKERMDSAISRSVRNHLIMGNIGRQVGLNNLEMKDIRDAKIAIIKKVRPDMRLDGKSNAYINGAFESARKAIKAKKVKDTSYQKRQMFNKDSRDVEKEERNTAESARDRMIKRLYKK